MKTNLDVAFGLLDAMQKLELSPFEVEKLTVEWLRRNNLSAGPFFAREIADRTLFADNAQEHETLFTRIFANLETLAAQSPYMAGNRQVVAQALLKVLFALPLRDDNVKILTQLWVQQYPSALENIGNKAELGCIIHNLTVQLAKLQALVEAPETAEDSLDEHSG